MAAARKAAQLRNEFDEAILALLTEEQNAILREADPPNVNPTRAMIIRLSSELPQPSDEAQSLADVVRELQLEPLGQLLTEFKLIKTQRVVPGITRDMTSNPPPEAQLRLLRRLRSYWRIEIQDPAQKIEQIVARFGRLEGIDLAYKELSFTDPQVYPQNDTYNCYQGYLDAAPTGIDARFAWTQPHGAGAGIGLVDLERGWHENHEDFVCKSPQIIFGDERPESERHGTAVLGEIVADDNAVGVVGIAPSTSYVFMTSYFDTGTYSSWAVASAIYRALFLMSPGDVLLLEVEAMGHGGECYVPAEIDDPVFDATQLAVLRGITVVSAAGNDNNKKGHDLDAYVNAAGKAILNRTCADFRDSGAIMVGAADSGVPHNRARFSNYGSRIDCYAWGRNVTTTGYKGDLDCGGGNPNAAYTNTFNGTSSAAPIIAGAAVILQGMAQANTGTYISPPDLRALLANPLTGTPQGNSLPGQIGVMPDLRAIIDGNSAIRSPAPIGQITCDGNSRFRQRRGAWPTFCWKRR
jgi:hypothetical protein